MKRKEVELERVTREVYEKGKKVPEMAIKATSRTIKYILILILAYTVISMIILINESRMEFLKSIVQWSVGGFWAFFMGYWGWMFAEEITKSVRKHAVKKENKDESYKN